MKARIKITLKNGVLDPQGKAIEGAIKGLGISGVGDVRQGKYIEVDLNRKRSRQGPLDRRADVQGPARQYGHRKLQLRDRLRASDQSVAGRFQTIVL